MSFNLGVNVVEVDGLTSPRIVAAPLSVTGFLIQSPRGVPGVPVRVRGFADFTSAFGGFSAAANGAFAVKGFFDNGGAEAVIVRVVGSGSNPASVMLQDRAAPPEDTLEITAGRRGNEDPGTWGNALSVTIADRPRGASAIPAQMTGTESEPFALSDGDTLDLTVNGSTPPVTITFDAVDFTDITAASAQEVVSAINRQTTAVRAAVNETGAISLASASTGTTSRLEAGGATATVFGLTNSDANLASAATSARLQSTGGLQQGAGVRIESRGHIVATGAPAGTLTDGDGIKVTADGGTPVNVTFTASDFAGGLGAVTPSEVVAAINRQASGFTAGLDASGNLVMMSNSYGAGSSILVEPPDAPATDAVAALGLDPGTNPPVAGAVVYRALTSVREDIKRVQWSGALGADMPTNMTRLQSTEFDLIVLMDGSEVERFESVTMQPNLDYTVDTVINDTGGGSRFITVSIVAGNTSGVGLHAPAAGTFDLGATAGTQGSDATPVDSDFIGSETARTGLYAFDTEAIQLLTCPETTAPGVVTACLSYCEGRGDMMFIGTVPRGYDLEGIKTYASAFTGRKIYGALYAPWIQITNPLDTTGNVPTLMIPPVGHVAGVYARIALARGVWKAPAGDEARVRNALGVEMDLTDADHTDLVKNGSVNAIRAIPGSGIVIDSSRTLSTDTRWLYVGTRRLFNFVKASLREGLRFVAQEPHDAELRQRVRLNVVTPFLLGLWRQGAFGSDPAEMVFTVKCDAENNPPAQVDLGYFNIEVYFYVTKPVETIVVIVGQQESGGTASES